MSHDLPATLEFETPGASSAVAVLRLRRAAKRNALDDTTMHGIGRFFESLAHEAEQSPEGSTSVRAVVLDADGDHFSAGLDLSELGGRDTFGGLRHSRGWHRCLTAMERGPVPVVAVLKGAVVGGGLELACAAHIRVAEPSTFYALPEGQRGLFVGGGASVRVPRLIGVHRMTDLMLTGRTLDADEGQMLGLSHYRVGAGEGLGRAIELAERIAGNAPLTNYAVLQALPRIAQSDPDQGYFTESLMATIAGSSGEAQRRMRDFVDGRAAKVRRPGEATEDATR